MFDSHAEVYIQLVWSTWDRLPLVELEIEREVYASIVAKARQLGGRVVAIGGVADHVHLLVDLGVNTPVAVLAQQTKGVSSHLVTHVLKPGQFFKWQGGYGAFSVSKVDLGRAASYVARQKQHHRCGEIVDDWEPGDSGQPRTEAK
jgi:REP element-mobilizing transposase RayT